MAVTFTAPRIDTDEQQVPCYANVWGTVQIGKGADGVPFLVYGVNLHRASRDGAALPWAAVRRFKLEAPDLQADLHSQVYADLKARLADLGAADVLDA